MASSSFPVRSWQGRVAVLAVFFCLVSGSCFGHAAYLTVPATPYDHQMARVQPLLATASQGPSQISLLEVNRWMAGLRAVPYQYSSHWQTPVEVRLTQATDCKGKAMALYTEMRRNGATNLRIVIGKHHLYNSVTHAWLEWDRPDGSYTLDPTFNEWPIKTAELDPMTYLPFYAYDGAHKYRVANGGFLAPTTRVATGGNNHFYSPTTGGTTYLTPSPRGLSSPAMAGFRQISAPVLNTQTQYLVSANSIAAASQTNSAPNVRHSVSSGVRHSHARSLAHRGHRVIRSRSGRLASS